jgi:hypothetical protein
MAHATKQAFGQPFNLCDDARRHLRARAIGEGGSGFTTRGFDTSNVTCEDCAAALRGGPSALPAPVIVKSKPIKNPLGAQIRADMLRRYGPSIEDPEWATEGFVP